MYLSNFDGLFYQLLGGALSQSFLPVDLVETELYCPSGRWPSGSSEDYCPVKP